MGIPEAKSSKGILGTSFNKINIKLLTISVLIVSILTIVGLVPFVNAQDEKPVMAIDMRHGSVPDLEKIALDKGWSVIRLEEQVTLQSLVERKISLFVISELSTGYTDQELEELKAYVAKGGNIAVEMPENYGSEKNKQQRQLTRELTKQFGIDIQEVSTDIVRVEYLQDIIVSDFPNHPLFKEIKKIGINTLQSYFYVIVEPPAEVLLSAPTIASPYNALLALFTDESGGRVIVYSKDMSSEEYDNTAFLANVLNWISPPGTKPPIVPKEIIKEIIEVSDPKSYWMLGIGIALVIIAIILYVLLARRAKRTK